MSILFLNDSYGQILKVIDSATKTTLKDININRRDLILNTGTNGLIEFKRESIGENIIISQLGYKPKSFNISHNDTTIVLAENIIRLGEVTIKSSPFKSFIVGNYQKKTNNVFVNSRIDKDINFTVVNKFIINQQHIEAILFYIAKDESYIKSKDIGSIEVVFYKETANNTIENEPFLNIPVNNYSIGWNKIPIPYIDEQNKPIYYGVRWIFNPKRYHYKNVTKKKTYNFYGPKLGVVSRENSEFHQTFFFNSEKGWQLSRFSPAMLALEINN